jgi:Uri superfamily endonuclease
MKSIIALYLAFASYSLFAEQPVIEFDEAQEIKCHAEIKKMGCTDTSDKESLSCIEMRKAKLTSNCKSIHDMKMSNN